MSYFNASNSFVPLIDEQRVHMSPVYIVSSHLSGVYNETNTVTNYLDGILFIHKNVLFTDVINMYQLNGNTIADKSILMVGTIQYTDHYDQCYFVIH